MMRNATQYYLLRGAIFVLLVTAFTAAGLYARNQFITDQNKHHASALVDQLLDAEAAQAQSIVDQMKDYRPWTDPELKGILKRPDATKKELLYASLALLPTDRSQADYLCGRMLTADYDQFPVIRDALKPRQDELIPRLWGVLEDDAADGSQRFRAGMALATYAPPPSDGDDARWRQSATFLVKYLLDTVGKDPAHYNPILTALRPVARLLAGGLGSGLSGRDAARVRAPAGHQHPGGLRLRSAGIPRRPDPGRRPLAARRASAETPALPGSHRPAAGGGVSEAPGASVE